MNSMELPVPMCCMPPPAPGYPPLPAAVPEPGAGLLFLAMALAAIAARRLRRGRRA